MWDTTAFDPYLLESAISITVSLLNFKILSCN
jgi:hypothetical protein